MDPSVERKANQLPQANQPSLSAEEAHSFFAHEGRILSDFAGASPFNFRPGEGWAIDPDTGDATFDIKFFEERGYTRAQALFASFHEIKSHLVEVAELIDTGEGDREYKRLKQRSQVRKRVHLLENCRQDAKGNLAILRLAPSLRDDARDLYREKLFPEADLTALPRHIQFSYAFLREAMVPDEPTSVDPLVKEELDKLRKYKVEGSEDEIDIIALTTNPGLDAFSSLKLSERFLEPAVERLFKEDVEEKKQQQNQQGQGQPSQGQGGDPQDSFTDSYDDYEENRHPEPMDDSEVEKKIREAKDALDPSKREQTAYEGEHGVIERDIADYHQEYLQVASQIEPYKAIFRRITEQRNVIVRRLKSEKEEGVMVDPGLIAQTHIAIEAGVDNPRTMMDFEGAIIPRDIPGSVLAYFLKDQSGSMRGEKMTAQRKGTIIETEALQEGSEILDDANLPNALSLEVVTAVIGFGVPKTAETPQGVKIYKSASKGLTERQRIDIFKGLLELGDIGTNDYDGLVIIEADIRSKIQEDPMFAEELKSGRKRAVVMITTDGGSNDPALSEENARARTKKKVLDLRGLGVKVKAIALAPMPQDISNIREVYGVDDTILCPSAQEYTSASRKVLENDVLGPLSITGNMGDIME